MANIDGGGSLSFKALLDNGQINDAIDETIRRVQGLSDITVSGGEKMDKSFLQTANGIREAIGKIGEACAIHEAELSKLEAEYRELGVTAEAALSSGNEDGATAAKERQMAIQGEFQMRKQMLEEARNFSDYLEEEAQKQEHVRQATEENNKAHQSLRGRIRELKEEMALLVDQGIDQQSDAYKALVNELGRLQDIQGDISQQGKILANDEARFQGLIQGLSGLAGGFSAATGAISLFAGENENLQKIMTKVQSVMAIAVGMQSVAQSLNKDSAFQLVTLNELKGWWARVVAKATATEVAETAATTQNTVAQQANSAATTQNAAAKAGNTVAQGAQTAAATAGTAANLTLAGAFRIVGAAIKSIPGFGWIIAGISAIIGLYSYFSNKASEAKKKQEEFSTALVDGCYKPIGVIEELSSKYTALGNNIKAKEQFIKDNQKRFDELGVSIKGVRDAESLLIDNKDAFVNAQIAKAKALIYSQQAGEKIKELIKLQQEYEAMPDKKTQWVQSSSFGTYNAIQVDNDAKTKKKAEIDNIRSEIKSDYKKVMDEEAVQLSEMKKTGVKSVTEYKDGTVGAIEKAIQEKQSKLKELVPNSAEWKATYKDIEELQKQIAAPEKRTTSKTEKDPFVEQLKERKAEYDMYAKWQNSTNEDIRKAASTEFSELVKHGNSYKEFLERLQDQIGNEPQSNRTREQLSAIRNELIELEKTSVMESFNESLRGELDGAESVLRRLEIIEQKRKELSEDGTDVDNNKKQVLDDAEKDALRQQQEQTKELLNEYASYLDKKIAIDLAYSNDLALLERARANATSDIERKKIEAAIKNREAQYKIDSKTSGDQKYDQMLQTYRSFEQKMLDITNEFEEERQKAREQGNEALIAEIDKAEQKAKSKLALDEMQESPDWSRLFDNFDEMGEKELEKLLALIEGKTAFFGVEFDPKDLETIKNKINELKAELRERNPFKALSDGFNDFKKAASQDEKIAALASMMDSAAASGAKVKGILTDIMGTLDSLGVDGMDEIGYAMQAFEGFASGASDAIMGIASGNPVQIVSGAVKAIGSVVSYFAGANDRRAERMIQKHKENVERLTSAYKDLEWQISKALGGSVYKHQQAAIDNMKQQQRELQQMIAAERSKKKADKDKIKEMEEQIKDLNRAIADMIEEMKNNLLGTDVKGIAQQLGDAIINAFMQGTSAANAWGNAVKDIVNNVVKSLLIQKILQEPIDKIISKYTSHWVDSNGVFQGFDVVINDIDSLSDELTNLYPSLEAAIEALKDKLDLSSSADTSLTGAVKGVTEETASIVAGQLNAMRINQVEASAILRQQLAMLTLIASNSHYLRFLLDIHKEIKKLTISSGNNPLRAKGLA